MRSGSARPEVRVIKCLDLLLTLGYEPLTALRNMTLL